MIHEKKGENNRHDDDKPQIYALKREKGGWSLNRRDFLKAAAVGGAAAVMMGNGCGNNRGSEEVCGDGCLAHSSAVREIAISPDGRLLASGSEDTTIKIWSLADGALIRTLAGHTDGVVGVAFSPDGRLLASGGLDDSIKLWSLPDGALLRTLTGQANGIKVAISSDGRFLVSGSGDGTLNLWSLPEGNLVRTIQDHEAEIYSIAITPDGVLLVSCGFNYIKLWSLPDGALVRTINADMVFSIVAISPDGRLLVSGSSDNDIMLWSLPDGAPVKTIGNETVSALALSLDGQWIASAGFQAIKLWSLSNGRFIRALTDQAIDVDSLAFSPDARVLVSAGRDGTIRFWSLPDGNPMGCLVDREACPSEVNLIQYQTQNGTVTRPASSLLPSGTVCTCNTVAGGLVPDAMPDLGSGSSGSSSGSGISGNHYWYSN